MQYMQVMNTVDTKVLSIKNAQQSTAIINDIVF